MTPVVLYPEMIQAGQEAYWEARRARLDDENVVIAVFLAMRMVEEMANLTSEVVH